MVRQQAVVEGGAVEGRESGLHTRTPTVYALSEGQVQHPLRKSRLVVGRSPDADIVLSGVLVSRRHAEFHETEAGLIVIDLDSQNGVFVNDVRITSPTALLIGDQLTIGDNVFVLSEVPSAPFAERTPEPPRQSVIRESSRVPVGTFTGDGATRRADSLFLLTGVADKALALGRGRDAEHVLGPHLVAALSDAAAGRPVAPEVARASAQYAVKLAAATAKATWLDFAFRLYEALGEAIPLPIVDAMYPVLRHVRGIDRELLQRYTQVLRQREAQLSPPERFVLQRLEGLERLAAWHPAN